MGKHSHEDIIRFFCKDVSQIVEKILHIAISDLHEKFTRDVSMDYEELINSLEIIRVWIRM